MGLFQSRYRKLKPDINPMVLIESIIEPDDNLSIAIWKGKQYLLSNPSKKSCAIHQSSECIYVLKQDKNKIDLYIYKYSL
jgi:hypothetical protein